MFIYVFMTSGGNRIFTKNWLKTPLLVTKAKKTSAVAFSSYVVCLKYVNTHVNMQSSFINRGFNRTDTNYYMKTTIEWKVLDL